MRKLTVSFRHDPGRVIADRESLAIGAAPRGTPRLVALGQGEQARESYQKALAIAERLAQAEPDRADYQVDLSISLVKIGTAGASPDQGFLGHALQILRTLDAQGRLMEKDKPKIPALEAMISPKRSKHVKGKP